MANPVSRGYLANLVASIRLTGPARRKCPFASFHLVDSLGSLDSARLDSPGRNAGTHRLHDAAANESLLAADMLCTVEHRTDQNHQTAHSPQPTDQ
jgi:hypothetical protein